jgi:beta-N-acetylhexosaminidase
VIVEHYTGSTTFSSAYKTFAADVPDSELHELPGTCAHFIVDTDGTIYQLVNLGTRCRHTVGLNYTAIGIEHVGTSDSAILHNRRQLSASLRLTLWLSRKFGIKLRNVIGHNESLTSPYHKELYPAWRCQTHGDWTYADMTLYRSKLRKLARRYAIDLGALPKQGHTSC